MLCYNGPLMRGRRQLLRVLLAVVFAIGAGASLVAVASFGSGAGGTTTATLTPVADSYVRADKPTRNFGRARSFVVAERPASIAYLRFKVAIPPGATVERATLRLFATSKPKAGFTVHRVARTAWGETTTNYRNAPPVRSRVAASPGPDGRAYVSVDVTSLVPRGGLVSLAVKGGSPSPLRFTSRESRSGQPRLVVETSVVTVGTGSSSGGTATAPPPPATPTPTPAPGSPPPPVAAGGGGGANRPCGTVATPPSRVDHVIWIWMENKPYNAIIGSPSAPFETELAAACGVATNFYALTRPSLPNYIAATSGDTQRIADNDPPSAHPLAVPSLFSQVKAAGKTWRSYQESAPGPCTLTPSGLYAVKHDPAPYYTGIRGDCAAWDVPMGTTAGGNFLSDLTNGTLPAFSFVTPDLCNGTHDCPVATGDAWLRSWFAKILASPSYLSGRTVVFLTWDEDDYSDANHIPTLVVSPSTPAGTRSGTYFTHYALLKTTEQLLGITPYLGHAGDPETASMVSSFNLG